MLQNKMKIVNDPVYGFITIPDELIFDLIEHKYFQRLRRIQQLGLTHFVYPGALHTRFHHAIGAMHQMTKAINTLRYKGHQINKDEELGVLIAILLHDIGHGAFSHSLEGILIKDTKHEEISKLFMERLNKEFDGALSLAIRIYEDKYERKFLHQLISGQMDMDRMDYLKRDCFFTGVSEGIISSDRIIDMLELVKDELVVEEKGIYSIENFIIARRLMFWQVYLHKTVISASNLLIKIIKRAQWLALSGKTLFASPALQHFLQNPFNRSQLLANPELLDVFAELDDYDVMASIKVWMNHEDKILSELCQRLIYRKLYKIRISEAPFDDDFIKQTTEMVKLKYKLSEDETDHYVFNGKIRNNAYDLALGRINILLKNGEVREITEMSNYLNYSHLSREIVKHYICYFA